jgi:hypothetical protein
MKKSYLNALIILTCSMILASCNKADEYSAFVSSGAIVNSDPETKKMCSESLNSQECSALKYQCIIVYGDTENEQDVRPFSACIDNPNRSNTVNSPEEPVVVNSPEEPAVVNSPEEPAVVNSPEEPAVVNSPEEPAVNGPEEIILVEDFVGKKSDCNALAEKYLLRTNIGQPKVLVCHSNHNFSLTISVACPALKAHTAHQYNHDYLGACRE